MQQRLPSGIYEAILKSEQNITIKLQYITKEGYLYSAAVTVCFCGEN